MFVSYPFIMVSVNWGAQFHHQKHSICVPTFFVNKWFNRTMTVVFWVLGWSIKFVWTVQNLLPIHPFTIDLSYRNIQSRCHDPNTFQRPNCILPKRNTKLTDIMIYHMYVEPQGQPFINGCFSWMIPNLYIGNGWKSPNIYFKLVVRGSRYWYVYTIFSRLHWLQNNVTTPHPYSQSSLEACQRNAEKRSAAWAFRAKKCHGNYTTRWWFQIFFIFTPIWGRFLFWVIFFRWVETTN